MRKVFNNRGIVGIFLLMLSLVPNFLSSKYRTGLVLTLFFASYCIGITFICDYFVYKISKQSVLAKVLKTRKRKIIYFSIGLLGGIILEMIVTYFGGLWIYPFYSIPMYFAVTILCLGFGAYFLSIMLSYIAIKLLLDKLSKGKEVVTRPYKVERILFNLIFIIGVIGVLIVTWRIFYNTNIFRDFIFNISLLKRPYLEFEYVILAFFSIWFIFEYIEFIKKRNSLIKNLLHGYFNPLLAALIASSLLSTYMEVQNVPIRLWIYTNWPLQNVKLFEIPILVYIAWPLHYIGFLSLYRALGDDPSAEIWAGDKIE